MIIVGRRVGAAAALVLVSLALACLGAHANPAAPPGLCAEVPLRPRFHVMGPPVAGTNDTVAVRDVNAIFSWRGAFHIMHQQTAPAGPPSTFGWGHVTSTDLVTWRRLPMALVPTESYDGGGVRDGSLSIVDGKQPVILYDCQAATAARRGCVAAARPADVSGDTFLEKWDKDASSPVEVSGPAVYSGPSSAWRSGAADDGPLQLEMTFISGANVSTARYQAVGSSMLNWTLQDPDFYSLGGPGGGGQFVELPLTSQSDSVFTHMLQVDSGAFPGAPQFVLGTLDPVDQTFSGFSSMMQPLDVGCLAYTELGYVPNTAKGSAGKRLLMVGWVGGSGPCGSAPYQMLSIVREVTFDSTLQVVVAQPVEEQASLRAKQLVSANDVMLNATKPFVTLLDGTGGNKLDLELAFSWPSCPGIGGGVDCLSFGISLLGPAAPGQAQSDSAGSAVRVTFTGVNDQTVIMNITMGAVELPPYRFSVIEFQNVLDVRILVDGSVVEVFAAGGRGVATITGLPAGSGVYAFADIFAGTGIGAPEDNSAVVLTSAKAWTVGCGWAEA